MIKVERIRIPSLETEKPRRLYIYTPADYTRSEESYPVLYMFDGHNVFYDSHATYGRSWGMKQYLERTRRKLIVVGVECNPEGNKRLNEYTPFDFSRRGLGHIEARGSITMDWIVNTLKPRIDAEYRTLNDREHTWIAGSSMGGLMSIFAAVCYNGVFSRAAALSPSMEVDQRQLKAMISSAQLEKPTLIYLDIGTAEYEGDTKGQKLLFDIAKKLAGAGAFVAARTVPDALHNEAAWEKRIPVFMDFLDRA